MMHGDILVNEVAVGRWEAVRGEAVMNDTYRYACKLYYRNSEGHPLFAEFQVIHWEKGGAVQLSYQILGNGLKKLKGYAPGQDVEFPI